MTNFFLIGLKKAWWWLTQIKCSPVALCSGWDESHTRVRGQGGDAQVSFGMLDYILCGK